jgi:hypothetical protein
MDQTDLNSKDIHPSPFFHFNLFLEYMTGSPGVAVKLLSLTMRLELFRNKLL